MSQFYCSKVVEIRKYIHEPKFVSIFSNFMTTLDRQFSKYRVPNKLTDTRYRVPNNGLSQTDELFVKVVFVFFYQRLFFSFQNYKWQFFYIKIGKEKLCGYNNDHFTIKIIENDVFFFYPIVRMMVMI